MVVLVVNYLNTAFNHSLKNKANIFFISKYFPLNYYFQEKRRSSIFGSGQRHQHRRWVSNYVLFFFFRVDR